MAKTLTIGAVVAGSVSGMIEVPFTVSGVSGTFTALFPLGTSEADINAALQLRINEIAARDYTTLASQASTLNTALSGDTIGSA